MYLRLMLVVGFLVVSSLPANSYAEIKTSATMRTSKQAISAGTATKKDWLFGNRHLVSDCLPPAVVVILPDGKKICRISGSCGSLAVGSTNQPWKPLNYWGTTTVRTCTGTIAAGCPGGPANLTPVQSGSHSTWSDVNPATETVPYHNVIPPPNCGDPGFPTC